ncbi:MAG: hypothetical protein ACREJN_13285 [Nitrospiraceae bacterium]
MVRCLRTHCLSIGGSGRAWAMAGGIALGVSAKSGIGDEVDASNRVEGVSNAVTQKQRTIARERRKERQHLAPGVGDCGIGVVGSILPFLLLPICDNHGESKGDAFPSDNIPRTKEPGLLQNQAILRLTKNGPEMSGKATLNQAAEVEGAAYAEKVRMGDWFCF